MRSQRNMTMQLLLVVLCSAAFSSFAAAQDTYQIDKVHSNILFKTKHFDTEYVWGRFDDFSGTVTFNPAAPETGSIEITIIADSIDTNYAKRDQDIKGPDFFNTKQFPTITFKSTAIRKSGDQYEVTGDLFVHGVTKSITVPFSIVGQLKNQRGARIGGEASFMFKRTDYNMKYMAGNVADEVQVFIDIAASRR